MTKNKGAIGIGMIITIGTLVAGTVAAVFSMTAEVKGDVVEVQKEVATVSERTAKLETYVPIILEELRDIKESQKNVETYFRIPQK